MNENDLYLQNQPPETLPSRLGHYWRLLDIFLIGLGVLFLLFGGLGFVYVWFDIPLTAAGDDLALTLPLSLSLIAVNIVAFALPVAIVLIFKKQDSQIFGFGWLRPSPSWFFSAAAWGIVAIFSTNLIAYLVFLILGNEPINPQLDVVLPEGFTWFGAIGMTLGVGILVPIAEEMLFRGVIHRGLRQFLSFWPAVIISSFLFGLLHIEPAIAVGAAILGGICAWIYERSQSIWTAIIIHLVNNASKVIFLYLLLALDIPLE